MYSSSSHRDVPYIQILINTYKRQTKLMGHLQMRWWIWRGTQHAVPSHALRPWFIRIYVVGDPDEDKCGPHGLCIWGWCAHLSYPFRVLTLRSRPSNMIPVVEIWPFLIFIWIKTIRILFMVNGVFLLKRSNNAYHHHPPSHDAWYS